MANIPHRVILRIKEKQFFETLGDELLNNGVVKITNLGVFKLKRMKAHSRYIPGSRKVQDVDSYVKVVFTPTKTLKVKLQDYGEN